MIDKMESIGNFSNMYRHQACGYSKVLHYVIKPKLHGTNASVRLSADGTIEYRSKNRIVSLTDDHFGFCFAMESEVKTLLKVRKRLGTWIGDESTDIIIFGEWAGKGVQKTDAVSQVDPKCFFPFSILTDQGMYNGSLAEYFVGADRIRPLPVMDRILIDFDETSSIQPVVDKLNEITNSFEEVDPYIHLAFDIVGPGEGIVGAPEFMPTKEEFFKYAFKAKTEAHRVASSSKAVSAREPLPQESFEFASKYVTIPRLKQAMFELGIESPQMKDTQKLIAWMEEDVMKESKDDLLDMGIEYKLVKKVLCTRIVQLWKGFVNGDLS